jgi:hypothetical protein
MANCIELDESHLNLCAAAPSLFIVRSGARAYSSFIADFELAR